MRASALLAGQDRFLGEEMPDMQSAYGAWPRFPHLQRTPAPGATVRGGMELHHWRLGEQPADGYAVEQTLQILRQTPDQIECGVFFTAIPWRMKRFSMVCGDTE